VLVLRLLLWANPLVDLLVGMSQAPFRAYFVGTVVGLAPITALNVILGKKGIDLATKAPGWLWAVLLISAAIGYLANRWRLKRIAAGAESAEPT
jgi:uncharacterized membrane protein YdjX (TVP38/TMEM64 family)